MRDQRNMLGTILSSTQTLTVAQKGDFFANSSDAQTYTLPPVSLGLWYRSLNIGAGTIQVTDGVFTVEATTSEGCLFLNDGSAWHALKLGGGGGGAGMSIHDLDSSTYHAGIGGATENNLLSFNALGLPKDSGSAVADFITLDALTSHAAKTATHGVGLILGSTESQTIYNKTFDADNMTITNLKHGAEVDNLDVYSSGGAHGFKTDQPSSGDDAKVLQWDFSNMKHVYATMSTGGGGLTKHDIDSATYHGGVTAAVENNLLSFDANGLPKDSGKNAADIDGLQFLHKIENQMGDFVGGIAPTTASGTAIVRPSSGETWCITSIEKTLETSLLLTSSSQSAYISYSPYHPDTQAPILQGMWFIDYDNWLTIYDASANGQTFYWKGFKVDNGTSEICKVVVGFTDPYGSLDIRPNAGAEWMITAVGLYDINVTNGTSVQTEINTQDEFTIYNNKIRITNSIYLETLSATPYSGFVLVST